MSEREPEQKPQENQGLLACAQDLLAGIEEKDANKIAIAMRAAFQLLEMEPHDEISHDEEKSE